MRWREGCAPWPGVAPGAAAVAFDPGRADEVGAAVDRARRALDDLVDRRAGARPRLAGWRGEHRLRFDATEARARAVLATDPLGRDLGRLRHAWEAAVAAQRRANRAAAPEGDTSAATDP